MPFLPALGPAIGAAFAGASSWLAGGSLLAGIAKAGFGIAAQFLVGSVFGKKQKGQAQKVKLEVNYGDDLPRTIVLGTMGVAGHHVFRNAYGEGNRKIQDVHILSSFRTSAISRARVEGEWRSFNPSETGDQGNKIAIPGDDKPNIYVKRYYGAMDQEADPGLITHSDRWTEDHIGAGMTYVVASSFLNREALTSPWEPFFEVVGPALYDWRKDDTVGGDGDDRWADQDSWSGRKDNPVLQMYLLERGVYNGTELIVGKGAPASRLPLAEWTVAANICDELIELEERYKSSTIASAGSGVTHDNNMQPLLDACAASWVEDASGEYPIVGANQAVVATITDDDIVLGQPYRYSRFRPRSELINTISGTYVEADVFYESKDFAVRIDEDALAIDRERLAVSISYEAVTDRACVDRLADIALRSSRFQANAEICLRPKFLALKPGQWIEWESDRHGTRTFMIISKRLGALTADTARLVYVTLQEVGEGIFDPTEYETLPPPILVPGDPVYASEPTNFIGLAISFTSDGQVVPALQFTWNAYDDVTVIATEVEYRKVGSTDSVIKSAAVPLQVIRTADGVLSDTDMEFRRRIVTDPPRTVFWTDWEEVHTTAASSEDVSVELGNLQPDVLALLSLIRDQADTAIAELNALALANTEDATQLQDQQAWTIRFRDATVSALTKVTLAIGTEPDGSLTAVGEILTALQAAVGDASAGILWRFHVEAGSGDVVARVVLQLRATVDDAYVTVGTIWETGFTGGNPLLPFGRIVQFADQFIITDGTEENLPFLFEDGILKLGTVVVNFAQITEGQIVSAQIGNLQVQTSNLGFGAVTAFDNMNGSFADGNNNWPEVLNQVLSTVTIDNPGGFPVKFTFDVILHILGDVDNSGLNTVQFKLRRGSTDIYIFNFDFDNSGVSDGWLAPWGFSGYDVNMIEKFDWTEHDPPSGSSTYTIVWSLFDPLNPGASQGEWDEIEWTWDVDMQWNLR